MNTFNKQLCHFSFLLLSILSILSAWVAHAQEQIIWQLNHAPPSTIVHGEFKNKGFIDLILKEIIDQLPQYEHVIEVSTLASSSFEIRAKKNVCLPALFDTPERQKFMVFSNASIAHPSNRIVLLKSKALTMPASNLRHLLANKALFIGLDQARSYGSYIDAILADFEPAENIYRRESESPNGLIEMVVAGRLDYTLAYPFQIQYYLQSHGYNGDNPLIEQKIEGLEPFSMGKVACADTPWGRNVIKQVNEVLARIKPTKAYQNAMTTWWRQSAADPTFVEYYQNVFLTH